MGTEVQGLEQRKVTIYRRGGFGYKRIEARAYAVTIGRWAQYQSAVTVRFLVPRARKADGFVDSHQPGVVILDGWGHPDVASPLDVTSEPGAAVTTSMSRHASFSPEWDTEFQAFIAKVIASGATVLHDFRGFDTSAPQKIAATEVRLLWSESNHQKRINMPLSWADANLAIVEISQTAPEGGAYTKTGYRVTWADGRVYEGRIDVTRVMRFQARPLTAWIKTFNENLSGRKGGERMAEIARATEAHHPGAIAAASELLDRRDIGE